MSYQARHILCPLCDKGFVAFLQAFDYDIKGHEGQWEKMRCHKCYAEIYVSDTVDYVLLAEDVASVQKRLTM